ncbi:MAG: hypothetical protein KDC24_02135 [Saprospiraceae bacterium]|nr:hypothetical protein [Saprospiraceae bacterium]
MKKLLFLFLSIVVFLNLDAQTENWNLVTAQDNISVYTADAPNGYKTVKITATAEARLETFLSYLNDVNSYQKWVYKCGEAHKVKSIEPGNFIYYTRTEMPGMFSDRDLVVHSKQWLNQKDGIYHSESTACPREIPEENGIVRIQHFDSKWELKETPNGNLTINYIVSTDPGGSIPAWLVNMGITYGPIETMKNLITLAEKKEVQYLTYNSQKR